jgi:hypothetical protein
VTNRDSILCRVHYRSDGELAPLEIRGIGVGQYDASAGPIAAADFYELQDGRKAESVAGFVVEDLRNGSWVGFRRVHGIRRGARITVRGGLTYPGDGRIEVRRDEPGGALLATMELGRQNSGEFVIETTLSGDLPERSPVDLCLVVRGSEEPSVWIREFQFEDPPAVCG